MLYFQYSAYASNAYITVGRYPTIAIIYVLTCIMDYHCKHLFFIQQVQFTIRDEGGLMSGTFTLIVNVVRNHAPTLTISPASINIDRTQPTNIEFARCASTDPDTVVSTFFTPFFL